MKIALANSAFENLGIEYISAVLKPHHETFLLFDPLLFNDAYINIKWLAKVFEYKKILLKQLESNTPDMVAFSVVSDTYVWACNLAKSIKERYKDITIVFGGVHVTAVPFEVLKEPYIDYIIIGEGEYPILELANALENKLSVASIKNLGYKQNQIPILNSPRALIQDLDVLPFPDKELFLRSNPCKIHDYGIITSRGCYYACTYCHNSADRKMVWCGTEKYFRQRSVNNVIQELKIAKHKYKCKQISIWDECFTFYVEWLKQFCSQYRREIDLPFWANVHPAHVSKEVVELLEQAGCTRVEMGVQVLNQSIKKEILHRHESIESIESAIKMFKESNIRIEVDIILGIPFMKESDYIEMVEFFDKVRPSSIHTFWLRYYPSTDIVDIALKHNILSNDEIQNIRQGEFVNSSILGGNTKSVTLEKYQTLLTFLPYMSSRLIQRILRNNRIKYIPRVTAINRIILYLLDIKHHDEVVGRRYIQKTFYFTWKKLLSIW